ncbi:MAG: acyltransferase [Actinomycetia bacterium]|nr:acyltransferase [Actinomycetes bacterium]
MNASQEGGHIKAIDGLRAVAVFAVLLFHAEVGVAPGGFLGVSLFFTLSGYLITTLLLREHATSGTISIRSFYARRWRRLIPSAWLCIAGVLAAWLLWSASQQRALPGDALASLGNAANWRFAFAERSYQDLFIGRPSPLAHFWSLAIEEQFYAVMPLIAALSLRRSRHFFAVVAGAMLLASVAANLLTGDRDLVYNGTHTRAAELLVGVLLAIYAPRIAQRGHALVGWGALALFGALVATTSVSDGWLYHGGLPAFSLVSAALVATVIAPRTSALTAALATRPLVAVGRWSYALYLVHWPIFLALDTDRTGLASWPLFAVRASLSLAVAAFITTVVERPIRTRRVLVRRGSGFVSSCVVAAGIVAVCVVLPAPTFSDNERLLAAGESGQILFDEQPAGTDAEPLALAPVLVVGSGIDVPRLLRARGFNVVDGTNANCPLTPAVEVQLVTGEVVDTTECPDSVTTWLAAAAAAGVSDVVVALGAIDEGVVRDASEVGFPSATDYGPLAARWLHVADTLNRLWDTLDPDVSVHLVRVGRTPDGVLGLQEELTRFAAGRSLLDALHFSIASVVDGLHSTPAETAPLRVLVVGDSTSVILANAIHQAQSDRVNVMWIGGNGCPFIEVAAIRSTEDEPWAPPWCHPTIDIVTDQLEDFEPDVVVLMVSFAELRHQRYVGDDRDHVAGDPQYTKAHDDYMAAFMALLAGNGSPRLLVADCPQLRETDVVNSEMVDPARIAAWNAQVQRWVDSSPDIALLPYAAAINERQRANPHEKVLVDGVHADSEILTEILRTQLFDELLAAAAGTVGQ